MKYRFIAEHAADYSIVRLCAALEVARSGYYAWRKRQPRPVSAAELALMASIKTIRRVTRQSYGYRRMTRELRQHGWSINPKKVARIMRQNGWQVQAGQQYQPQTTQVDPQARFAPNHLSQDFAASAPDQKWVADLTFIRTRQGWLYLVAILDLFSRKVVGWHASPQPTAQLVATAYRMALFERQPPQRLLFHSDRGTQFTSQLIKELHQAQNLVVSMSRTGNCYDNAPIESFFARLKVEWIQGQVYPTLRAAYLDVVRYIASFYNTSRLHSALDYVSPAQYEAQYYAKLNSVST